MLPLEGMRTDARLAGAILLCLAAACSSSSGGSHDGAPGNDGGRDGTDAGNAACDTAAEHGACATEGVVCGDCFSCQSCNLLRCTSGQWTAMEAAAAPCFTCGGIECPANATFCELGTPTQPAGGLPTNTCQATPSACLLVPTCACVQAQAGFSGSTCTEADGGVTVHVSFP